MKPRVKRSETLGADCRRAQARDSGRQKLTLNRRLSPAEAGLGIHNQALTQGCASLALGFMLPPATQARCVV